MSRDPLIDGITTDSNDNIYVADSGRDDVQVFSQDANDNIPDSTAVPFEAEGTMGLVGIKTRYV